MNNKNINKKVVIIIIVLLALLVISMLIANFYVKADAFANMVTIDKSQITSIQTGTGPFDTVEGLGNDVSDSNRIVRSFDSIIYNVEFNIKAKENANVTDFEDRKVEIIVSLSDEDIKYVSFGVGDHSYGASFTIDEDGKTARYIVDGVNTYSNFTDKIVLNVNNAPNNYEIKPTFSIKETTDEDNPKEIEINKDIINYIPTIVTSKANIDIVAVSSNDTQTGSINGEEGRFVTFGIGIQILGDTNEKGIKGMQIPSSDISFDIELSQSNGEDVIVDNSYIRPYKNENIDEIRPVSLDLPYNINNSEVSINKKSGNIYTVTISNYNADSNTLTGSQTAIENNRRIFVSIALTCFSKRADVDGKNDIVVSLNVNSSNDVVAKTIMNEDLKEVTLSNNIAQASNRYQEENDYGVTGSFVSKQTYNELSNQGKGYGSVTRGDEIAYKSTFNFKNSVLKTGISQIIKVDPNAYEIIKLTKEDDYKINLTCESEKCNISKGDFTVKFVTGDFSKDNFEVINYSNDTMDSSLLPLDSASIMNQCKIVKNNFDSLTSDQIMNLYGGPCIKAKDGTEKEYTSIDEIGNERISKIILETKEDKILDSSITVDFIAGFRVKNVPDITQTYQGVTLVKSKNAKNMIYFSPSVTDDSSSVANYNNYIKTTYNGTNAVVDNKSYGDSLKIISYSSRNEINITNKKSDGTKKTTYNIIDNDILNYKINVNINDNSMNVGSDDVWYIKSLQVTVVLPSYITFKQNSEYSVPEVILNSDGTTTLIYNLPYTKPNQTIDPIYFDATFKPNIKGSNNEVVVTSTVDAINVNNEKDTSAIGSSTSKEIIYVNGYEGIIVTEEVGDIGEVVEKDKDFNYSISLYNSSNKVVENVNLMSILPHNNDEFGSSFNGSYTVKLLLPSNISNAKAYCYTDEISKINKNVDSNLNKWEECNITNEYVDAKAFKLENININPDSKIEGIVVQIKPKDNDYNDKYYNITYAKSDKLSQSSSQATKVRVVNRSISGQVFVDQNQNGIKDDNVYLSNINVSLCKLDSYNKCTEIDNIETDENGKYSFNKLDVGRYKVNFLYNTEEYDVTNRYFTQDETKDSDAYKVSDINGKAEISSKLNGIRVTKDIEKQKNYDIGLIPRKGFEIDIKKGINKVEINNNGIVNTYSYDFLKTVSLSIKKPNNLTAKVTYGFTVTNNRTNSGYIKLIEENIPTGLSFNSNYEENKGWFSVDGKVFYDGLKNTLINPGETKTFEITLDMNSRNEAGTFLNEVSIVELEEYEEKNNTTSNNDYYVNNFEIGTKISYAGVNFYVINDDGVNVTLLADENAVKNKMSHIASSKSVYKWSDSLINKYINNEWLNNTSIDIGSLIESEICDDASGLEEGSYGGTLREEGTCQSGIYSKSKVRLLTIKEFENLLATLSDVSFLVGNESYWTMNSRYIPLIKDEFGDVTNSVSNEAIYINNTTSPVAVKATTKANVRPVITVPKSNIILQ